MPNAPFHITALNLSPPQQDCGRGLYHSFYLNAATSFTQAQLDALAKATVESGSANRIQQVYDQHCSFLSLEDDLFVTNTLCDSYFQFNSDRLSDAAAQALVERVAADLFSVVVTLRVIPIIRAPRNGPAEMVATRLNELLHDHITNNKALASSYAFFRPRIFHSPFAPHLSSNLSILLFSTILYLSSINILSQHISSARKIRAFCDLSANFAHPFSIAPFLPFLFCIFMLVHVCQRHHLFSFLSPP